jgi:hypothetical protein
MSDKAPMIIAPAAAAFSGWLVGIAMGLLIGFLA